jgi:hypothetical protein
VFRRPRLLVRGRREMLNEAAAVGRLRAARRLSRLPRAASVVQVMAQRTSS